MAFSCSTLVVKAMQEMRDRGEAVITWEKVMQHVAFEHAFNVVAHREAMQSSVKELIAAPEVLLRRRDTSTD